MAISKRRHRHRGSQLQLLLVAVFLIPCLPLSWRWWPSSCTIRPRCNARARRWKSRRCIFPEGRSRFFGCGRWVRSFLTPLRCRQSRSSISDSAAHCATNPAVAPPATCCPGALQSFADHFIFPLVERHTVGKESDRDPMRRRCDCAASRVGCRRLQLRARASAQARSITSAIRAHCLANSDRLEAAWRRAKCDDFLFPAGILAKRARNRFASPECLLCARAAEECQSGRHSAGNKDPREKFRLRARRAGRDWWRR